LTESLDRLISADSHVTVRHEQVKQHLDPAFHDEYDVATDLDLHQEGRELLDRYKVVITGSHPEYWSEAGENALGS